MKRQLMTFYWRLLLLCMVFEHWLVGGQSISSISLSSSYNELAVTGTVQVSAEYQTSETTAQQQQTKPLTFTSHGLTKNTATHPGPTSSHNLDSTVAYSPSSHSSPKATTNVEPSATTTQTPSVSVATTQRTPKSGSSFCSDDKNICENGGICMNSTSSNLYKPVCVCNGDYYGEKCESSTVSNLYMQLTYAFSGTTAFLLLLVVVLLCCKRKKAKSDLGYSKELEDFAITNKRASMLANKNVVNVASYDNNIDMYGD